MDIQKLEEIIDFKNYSFSHLQKDDEKNILQIFLEPITTKICCKKCGSHTTHNSRHTLKKVRDISISNYMQVYLYYESIDYKCPVCKSYTKYDMDLVEPYGRATKRFKMFIGKMCNLAPPNEIAREFGIDDNTAYRYEKYFLDHYLPAVNFDNLEHIGVDEISFRKGHKYMTIIYDLTSLKAIPIDYHEGKSKESLQSFFNKLSVEQKEKIKTVNMDMSTSYIPCTEENINHADIIIDKFHVIKELNKKIDEVRKQTIDEIQEVKEIELSGTEKKRFVGWC